MQHRWRIASPCNSSSSLATISIILPIHRRPTTRAISSRSRSSSATSAVPTTATAVRRQARVSKRGQSSSSRSPTQGTLKATKLSLLFQISTLLRPLKSSSNSSNLAWLQANRSVTRGTRTSCSSLLSSYRLSRLKK